MAKILRSEQKGATKKNILEAALHEFSRNGYGGTNLRAIAAVAKVNHSLIAYHYKSKENLWKNAIEFMFNRSREMTAAREGQVSLSGVERFIRDYTYYCAKFPEHNRIMMQASMHDRGRLNWVIENLLKKDKDALLGNIVEQKKQGIWPDIPAVSIIYIVVSACQMVFAVAPEVEMLHDENVLEDDFIEAHANAIIKLFFHHKVK